MGKLIRSYGAFAAVGYRIWALVVLPLLLLVLAFLTLPGQSAGLGMDVLMLFNNAILLEGIADYWFLGGMLKHGEAQLAFFQTSKGGPALVRRVAVADCVRRFVYFVAFGLLCFAMTGAVMDLAAALAAYVSVTAMLNLTRHAQIVQMYMLLLFAVQILFSGFWALAWYLDFYLDGIAGVLLAVLMLLSILAGVASVCHVSYCMKGNCYER